MLPCQLIRRSIYAPAPDLSIDVYQIMQNMHYLRYNMQYIQGKAGNNSQNSAFCMKKVDSSAILILDRFPFDSEVCGFHMNIWCSYGWAYSSPETRDRCFFKSERRFLFSSLFCLDAALGPDLRRTLGEIPAFSIRCRRRCTASSRFRCCVRNLLATITISPDEFTRFPARRISRSRISGLRDLELRMLNRS